MLASITAGGTAVFHSDTDDVQTGFTQGNETTSTPISNSNILWGAAATAMLGATLADWQRKREEEEARKRAEAAAQEKEESGSGKKTPGQRAYEAMMKQKHIVGESQALLNEKAREKAEHAEAARQNLIAKNEDRAPVDMAKVSALVEAQKKAELQAGLSAYYEGRKAGEEKSNVGGSKVLAMPVKSYDPPWWAFINETWEDTKQWTQDHVIQPAKDYVASLPSQLMKYAKANIPVVAEWLYQNVIVPVITMGRIYPNLTETGTQLLNTTLQFEKIKMSYFTDTNPDTMTFTDLGKVWLYEYGDSDKIVFGSNANTTKEVMTLDGVQNLRGQVIANLQEGKIENVTNMPVEYGVDQYGHSLLKALDGQSGELFLGSYTVSVNVESKGDGVYVLHYEVANPSTWASATRFRNDMNGDHVHDSIIPDETPRREGVELGGKLEEVFKWSEEIRVGDAK